MIERDVKVEIKKILDARGAFYFMPVPTGYGVKGVSDFIVCYRGHYIAIEAKGPGGKPSPHQLAFGEKVRGAGGRFCVISPDNLESLPVLFAYLDGLTHA
jgi:hypothetical protein